MREHLGETFPLRVVVDLNGDVKGNIADENVFEIEQGVTIALMCAQTGSPELRFSSREGTRASKYSDLLEKTTIDSDLAVVEVVPPYYRWLPLTGGHESTGSAIEYAAWLPLCDVFESRSSGIQTKNDSVCIGWTASEIWDRVSFLAAVTPSDASRELGLRDGGVWSVASAQSDLRTTGPSEKRVRRILYRPFDWRFTYLTDKSGGFLGRPRYEVMKHMTDGGENIGLIFNRQIVGDSVSHFGVSRDPICHGTFYLGNKGQDYLAPLFLVGTGELNLGDGPRPHNIKSSFLHALRGALGSEANKFRPADILHYIYGVVHSMTYRLRYREHLKLDFPRIPIAPNTSLFDDLARLGGELVALHLVEAPKLDDHITTLVGSSVDFQVEKVSYSDETVWIDKAKTRGFRGVPEEVWNFCIGGYQVCEKWLKDRQAKGGKKPHPGRVLTEDDLAHYQKIVVALNETIRIMAEIDEVIEAHGSWPGAFKTAEAKAETATVVTFKPRLVEPTPVEHYVTCVPLVPLKAAAGAFSDPQHLEDDGWEWVAIDTRCRLRLGMFVAQVVGKSMEPAIPDSSYCLFAAPVTGTRQGKTVLVQLRDATDPETGERYTVKRYESEKTRDNDSWRHARITLKPVNPDFEPIILTGTDEGDLQVIAELVEVLGGAS
jgi:SOS-response transcriptional repressor LexA